MKRKKASALPLTCGECEHGVLSLPPPHLRCGRDRVLDRAVEADKAPPAWCPLRNRPKKLDGSRTGPVLRVDVPMVVVVGTGSAARRVCDECWQRNPVGEFSVFHGLCTLPCETCGAHPRPCFCEQCRPATPRREWRPAW